MPISDIQAEVLRRIGANRSPESYLAGATVLHRSRNSPRFSLDIDLFHDLGDSVARCAETDATTLVHAGYAGSECGRFPEDDPPLRFRPRRMAHRHAFKGSLTDYAAIHAL